MGSELSNRGRNGRVVLSVAKKEKEWSKSDGKLTEGVMRISNILKEDDLLLLGEESGTDGVNCVGKDGSELEPRRNLGRDERRLTRSVSPSLVVEATLLVEEFNI